MWTITLGFQTSTGSVNVSNWGYMLQGAGGSPLDPAVLAAASHDLIVSDFSRDGSGANRFTVSEISAIKDGVGGRSVAAAYMSIGEASEFRDHWDVNWTDNGLASGNLTANAPSWLGPIDAAWPESRYVRYWDQGWQDNIFNTGGTGWLDQIVAQGFDAAYLDIVEAYYVWAVEIPAGDKQPGDPLTEFDAAQRMVDFITALTAHARASNPDFFVIPQNGAFIINALGGSDPVREAAFLDAIGAIGVEDVYAPGSLEENNPIAPDADRIDVLYQDYLLNDIPVLAVDYLNNPALVAEFTRLAAGDGFLPYAAADRDLDVMSPPIEASGATSGDDNLIGTPGDDTINALGGNDHVEGLAGDDRLSGSTGSDTLLGGDGNDTLKGHTGRDRLEGGTGNDWMSGGAHNDRLIGGDGNDTLKGGDGKDWITGGDGNDRLFGGAGDDLMKGQGNWDWMSGEAGNDTLYAGIGGGRLYGGDDNDIIYGGDGGDHLHGDAGDDIIDGGLGHDEIWGGDGNDWIYGGDDDGPWVFKDYIYGGAGNDIIDGGQGLDKLYGNLGNDEIHGGFQDDYIYGGGGNDTLFGDSGTDYLYGENGADIYNAGAGFDKMFGAADMAVDKYVFEKGNQEDIVYDFEDGFDLIDLSAYGFADKAEAMALASQTGWGAVRINLSSQPGAHEWDSIWIDNMTLGGNFTEDDIII